MKAAIWDGPLKLVVKDVPCPAPAGGEVLVKTKVILHRLQKHAQICFYTFTESEANTETEKETEAQALMVFSKKTRTDPIKYYSLIYQYNIPNVHAHLKE